MANATPEALDGAGNGTAIFSAIVRTGIVENKAHPWIKNGADTYVRDASPHPNEQTSNWRITSLGKVSNPDVGLLRIAVLF
jgi:hypothetical protein